MPTYEISGTVRGLGGLIATVVASGPRTVTATTDASGAYTLRGVAEGSYTVTAEDPGYLFSPVSLTVAVAGGSVAGQDFGVAAMPVCTAGGWCWQNPLPHGNALLGVWGSSATDVWAVGDAGTIVHWDGSGYSIVQKGYGLRSVWGIAANDVWAVGYSGTILHWDGSAWSSVPGGGTIWLQRVWGVAANDAWAVGYGGTILHWDGSAWSSVASGTTSNLYGVWGSGAADVWAVGASGTILHWDGSAWSSVASGTTNPLFAVWGTGRVTSGPSATGPCTGTAAAGRACRPARRTRSTGFGARAATTCGP